MGDKIFEYNKKEIRRLEFVELLCWFIVREFLLFVNNLND